MTVCGQSGLPTAVKIASSRVNCENILSTEIKFRIDLVTEPISNIPNAGTAMNRCYIFEHEIPNYVMSGDGRQKS